MPQPRPVSKPLPQKQRAKAEYAKIPRKTKADDPALYTKVPHEYGDLLIAGGKLGGQLQRDLIYWIERHTWGNAKRPEFAKLSITQLAGKCQVWDSNKGRLRPVERKSVAVALADLEKRKIIEARDRKGCGKTTAKMYKLTPEHWRKAKPYEPPTPKELIEAEAAIEAEDEVEEVPAESEPESTVQNGKFSRPQAVSVRPSRTAEPVTIRLVYNPTGFDHAVTFRARTGANGRIQVTAAPAAIPPQTGEVKANDYGCAQPQLKISGVDNKRFTDFDAAINSISLQTWGITVPDEQVTRIMEAAADAPVELFTRIAGNKLNTRTAGRDHKPGLFVHLAAEAARSYAKEKAIGRRTVEQEMKASEARGLTPDSSYSPPEPKEPQHAKCWKCKGTGQGKIVWTNERGSYAPRPQKCGECNGSGMEATQ